jgi:hypothetical protein
LKINEIEIVNDGKEWKKWCDLYDINYPSNDDFEILLKEDK